MDPVIAQAGDGCGLASSLLHQTFPSELTMWIDPLEVSYRIGENGSICVLYEYKEGSVDPWKPTINMNVNKIQSTTSHVNNQNQNAVKSSRQTEADGSPSCKESLRNMDYLLDPRKSVSIEQLAAYVSS